MPGMDGFGFLSKYNDYPANVKSSSAIVMLTSSQNPDDITRAGNNPYVKDYLQKPMTKESISRVFNIESAASRIV